MQTEQTEISNEHVTVNTISSNEVQFVVTNGNHSLVTTVTNDGTNVNSVYALDGQTIYSSKQTLSTATQLGKAQQIGNSGLPSTTQNTATSNTIPYTDYYFDGMVYSAAGTWRPYGHPDKSYYGIPYYTTWSRVGNQDLHVQIDQYDSNSIIQAPAWAVGGGVGALVGGLVMKNLGGSVVGAMIGGALGAIYGGQVNRLTDENGCIWFTIDNNPQLVNLGSSWFPEWYLDVRYIELGPFSTTNYYYYEVGASSLPTI